MKPSFVAAAVLLVAVALTEPAAGRAPQRPAPTFNRDVAPILFRNCVTCHRPDGIAPMSLLTYDEAQPWSEEIKVMTGERAMPPWYADPQHGQFRNSRALTQAQIDTLAAWADAGAPRGDGTPPAPPALPASGWQMNRPPDQILELPFGEYDLPPQGEVPTFTIWMKLPLNRDRYVQAIEIRPSNRAAVHHSSLSLARSLPPGTTLGRAPVFPGGPTLAGVPVYGDGRPFATQSAESFGTPVMFYVPGSGLLQFPDGVAKKFGRNDWLAWGLHMISPGAPEKLRMQVGLWFARSDPHHEVQTWTVNQTLSMNGVVLPVGANGQRQMPDIPANAASVEMVGTLKIDQDITIYSLWPHMHYRGKDMTFVLREPNGRETTLLSVPHYNPHWQITYELARPLRVRRGSTITATGHYDNSAANPHNPNPNVAVRFGPQGTDEMYIPFLEVTVDNEDLRFQQLQELTR